MDNGDGEIGKTAITVRFYLLDYLFYYFLFPFFRGGGGLSETFIFNTKKHSNHTLLALHEHRHTQTHQQTHKHAHKT